MSKLTRLEEVSVQFSTSLTDLKSNERCFCSKNEILAFVDSGKLYAIPWNKLALSILEKEHFIRKDMYIPFEITRANKWEKLIHTINKEAWLT